VDAIVAVVRTRPETVLADYARLLRLAGLSDCRDARDRPPLALWLEPAPARLAPAATCPPWQLDGVVAALLAAGWPAADLSVCVPAGAAGEREPVRTWRRILAAHGVAVSLTPEPDAGRAPTALVVTGLRTDRELGVAGAVAALGAHLLTPAARREFSRRPEVFAAAWRRAGSPRLAGAVVDATVCGDGPGIGAQAAVAAHVLLASRDPVAADAIAARLLGCEPALLPLSREAAGAEVGCGDLARIELVGDVGDGLPSLGLVEAAGYRGRPGTTVPAWVRRLQTRWRDWRPDSPRARRNRRRYESSPWGRLHLEYERRSGGGGGRP